jgi:hypothetical protein
VSVITSCLSDLFQRVVALRRTLRRVLDWRCARGAISIFHMSPTRLAAKNGYYTANCGVAAGLLAEFLGMNSLPPVPQLA